MKAEAVLHASRGVDAGVIAGMVERAERTVRERPAEWRGTRMCWVPAGHAGNRDAVEPVRVRKQELEAILARPLGARGLDPPHAAPERAAHQAVRGPAEDVPVVLRRPPPTSRTVAPYPIEQNRDTWQTILALDRLQRETEAGKIAVVPDNARPHHAKALTGLHGPGRLLERITTIFLPPYVPDHQPGRARTERGQERHRHHPARDPRRNPRSIRPTRHRTHRRPRLRTPPAPRNQKRSCSMTAIDYQRLRGHLLSTEPSASFGLVGHTAVAVVGQPQAGIVLAAACRHLGAALRLDAISRSVPDAVVEESVVSDETRLPEAFLRVDADLAALAAEQMCLALGFAKRSLPGADQAVLKFTRLVAPRLYEIIGVSP